MMTHPDCTAMPADGEARIESDVFRSIGGPFQSAEQSAVEAAPHSNAASDDRFLSAGELASLIHVDASTLRRWRTSTPPAGPPFTRLSPRVVVYNIVDVRRWIALSRIDPAEAV